MKTRMKVNGKFVNAEVEPRTALGDFLRDRLNLTATHLGCEHGICGACTVLINGEPARACLTLAVACEGHEVVTLEGLLNEQTMEVLRQAFHRHHGLQCGFCTPGMLVSARDLIRRGKAGSAQEIREGLAGNICRCTGYTDIVKSIQSAADECARLGITSASCEPSKVPA